MQDHDASERLRGVLGGSVKLGVVDFTHDLCGRVANVFPSAVVIASPACYRLAICMRNRSSKGYIPGVQNAVAKSTKCDSRLMARSPVGELDLQDPNVVDDRRGDGGDEEENGGREEEEGPNVVNNSSASHLDGVCELIADLGAERCRARCVALSCVVLFTALLYRRLSVGDKRRSVILRFAMRQETTRQQERGHGDSGAPVEF